MGVELTGARPYTLQNGCFASMRFLKEPGMRLPKFEYMEPRSLKEASKTLALDPKGSVLLAGGTDTAEKGNLGV